MEISKNEEILEEQSHDANIKLLGILDDDEGTISFLKRLFNRHLPINQDYLGLWIPSPTNVVHFMVMIAEVSVRILGPIHQIQTL